MTLPLRSSYFGVRLALVVFVGTAVHAAVSNRTWTTREGNYFTGEVRALGRVQAWINVTGSEVEGRWLFTRSGQRFHLAGEKTAQGNITIRIGDAFGSWTNSYLKGRLQGRRPAFVGTWTSSDGSTNVPLRLEHLAERHVVHSVERLKGVGRQQEDLVHRVDVSFPQFRPTNAFLAQINRDLKSESRAEAAPRTEQEVDAMRQRDQMPSLWTLWQTRIDLEIDFASSRAVSLYECRYEYRGGAHGYYAIHGRNYWTKKGKVEALELRDLFVATSRWENRLSILCMENLNRQKAMVIVDALAHGEKDWAIQAAKADEFTLSAAGIHCHYSPELLGPYAQGESEVLISYSAIRPYLRDRTAARLGLKISPTKSGKKPSKGR